MPLQEKELAINSPSKLGCFGEFFRVKKCGKAR
jgi:hypothetical protein